jgi:hypothetical protein
MVFNQPSSIIRASRTLKEDVRVKERSAGEKILNEVVSALISKAYFQVLLYLHGSCALCVQRGVRMETQTGVTNVRGREKHRGWMLHLRQVRARCSTVANLQANFPNI